MGLVSVGVMKWRVIRWGRGFGESWLGKLWVGLSEWNGVETECYAMMWMHQGRKPSLWIWWGTTHKMGGGWMREWSEAEGGGASRWTIRVSGVAVLCDVGIRWLGFGKSTDMGD